MILVKHLVLQKQQLD